MKPPIRIRDQVVDYAAFWSLNQSNMMEYFCEVGTATFVCNLIMRR